MVQPITCKLCEKRRAKRACPAVNGDICAICCGEQREVVLSCPLECSFLREAHKHETTLEIPVDEISNPDIEVNEDFIVVHEELLLFCVYSVVQAALRTPSAVDTDVLEALAAVIQTYRTAQSGLVYETHAGNTVALSVQQKITNSVKDYRTSQPDQELLAPRTGNDEFRMFVFLHRIGQQNQNGRPKGRMFIDLLRAMVPETGVDERAPSIIL